MSLEQTLAARLRGRVTVVGIGNPLRADDAAGCLVARGLDPAPGLQSIEAEEVPESHLGAVTASRPDTIVLVDAVDLGASPGSLALVETSDLVGFTPTTHHVPLDILAHWLARETGAEVLLLAVQPRGTNLGDPVSPEVEEAARLAAATLNHALARRVGGSPC
jgi:hydrogenase 3 maturation protease